MVISSSLSSRVQAFTLIELLIVIAIIATIAAMLFPAIGTTQAMMKATKCGANLRQLGIYHEVYAGDHKQRYPPASMERLMRADQGGWLDNNIPGVHGWTNHGSWWHCWAYYLEPYLATGAKNKWGKDRPLFELYICPSHPYQPKDPGMPGSAYPDYSIFTSYGANTAVLDDNTSSWGRGWPGYGVGIPGMHDNNRVTDNFPNPTGTIQLAEHWGVDLDGTQSNGANWTWSKWTEPPNVSAPIHGRGAWAPIPSGMNPARLPASDVGKSFRIAHRGMSNFLFMDGHVKRLDPWSTVGPTMDASEANYMWTGRYGR